MRYGHLSITVTLQIRSPNIRQSQIVSIDNTVYASTPATSRQAGKPNQFATHSKPFIVCTAIACYICRHNYVCLHDAIFLHDSIESRVLLLIDNYWRQENVASRWYRFRCSHRLLYNKNFVTGCLATGSVKSINCLPHV